MQHTPKYILKCFPKVPHVKFHVIFICALESMKGKEERVFLCCTKSSVSFKSPRYHTLHLKTGGKKKRKKNNNKKKDETI